MSKIKIQQIKSKIGSSPRQVQTLAALGLTKLNSSVELEATAQVLGMVKKVNHLVSVKEA